MAEGNSTGVGRLPRGRRRLQNLVEIGPGLKCYQADFSGSAIESLPEELSVQFRLNLSGCEQLTSLPENLKLTSLNLSGCTSLTRLPEGLDVSFLNISGCTSLTDFPKRGTIQVGSLIATGCSRLRAIPKWVQPLSNLNLEGCLQLTKLPAGLTVTSWFDIADTGLTRLPPSARRAALRWRGVPIDYRTAFEPHKLKGKEVLAERNVEVRRVMMQQMGFERFLKEVDAEVLDQDTDPGGRRQLLRVELRNEEDLVCVSVTCPSTGRQYLIRVPPNMQTCKQAVAWTAGFDDPKKYKPRKET